MPMCVHDCTCRYCKISEMAYHPLFKDRVDELLIEFSQLNTKSYDGNCKPTPV